MLRKSGSSSAAVNQTSSPFHASPNTLKYLADAARFAPERSTITTRPDEAGRGVELERRDGIAARARHAES